MSQSPAASANAEDKPQPSAAEAAVAMKVEPTREHRWLQKFVGDWTYETEAPAEPGQPPHKMTGSERIRALGEIWVQGEGTSQMPDGSPATTQITLGYDATKKRFVGTWVGTMMAHLWIRGRAQRRRADADAEFRGPEHDRTEQEGELSRRLRVQERQPPHSDRVRRG